MSEKADARDLGKKNKKDGEKEKEKFKFSLHGSRPSSDVQYSMQSLSECKLSVSYSNYLSRYLSWWKMLTHSHGTFSPLKCLSKHIQVFLKHQSFV